MHFYAIIIDDELNHAPLVRLIASGPQLAPLRNIVSFNPYGMYSKIVKNAFMFKAIEGLTLITTFNSQKVNAHIYECVAR